jgi:acyl-CoA reductase-like NAD-dependent aldehyde dehydrogenase
MRKAQMKYILLIGFLLLSLNAYGALNKWVDADGNVHYSDEPPPDAQSAKTINIPPPASGAYAVKPVSEQEEDRKKTIKSQEEAAQKDAQQQQAAQIKQKNCEAARSNLMTLEKAANIVTYDTNGKPVMMDDAARKQSMEDNRKAVSENCGGESN